MKPHDTHSATTALPSALQGKLHCFVCGKPIGSQRVRHTLAHQDETMRIALFAHRGECARAFPDLVLAELGLRGFVITEGHAI